MLFDKLDIAIKHGLDTSNVSNRVVSRREEPSGIWAQPGLNIVTHKYETICYFTDFTAIGCDFSIVSVSILGNDNYKEN